MHQKYGDFAKKYLKISKKEMTFSALKGTLILYNLRKFKFTRHTQIEPSNCLRVADTKLNYCVLLKCFYFCFFCRARVFSLYLLFCRNVLHFLLLPSTSHKHGTRFNRIKSRVARKDDRLQSI